MLLEVSTACILSTDFICFVFMFCVHALFSVHLLKRVICILKYLMLKEMAQQGLLDSKIYWYMIRIRYTK